MLAVIRRFPGDASCCPGTADSPTCDSVCADWPIMIVSHVSLASWAGLSHVHPLFIFWCFCRSALSGHSRGASGGQSLPRGCHDALQGAACGRGRPSGKHPARGRLQVRCNECAASAIVLQHDLAGHRAWLRAVMWKHVVARPRTLEGCDTACFLNDTCAYAMTCSLCPLTLKWPQ